MYLCVYVCAYVCVYVCVRACVFEVCFFEKKALHKVCKAKCVGVCAYVCAFERESRLRRSHTAHSTVLQTYLEKGTHIPTKVSYSANIYRRPVCLQKET